ncbi:PREDICTED: DNA-directed RNA polymerase I subunit RPA1 [Nicrophorus vespilloides]|uniref:DNA-directed RNA polymerase subunit n=1 Tax=Nicrophorus vespilloides TaxID=110193 RepID=A0ABM1MAH4_NICVS|nr:PREDICTED: DNA-directed RNA polymerase I subunit RPA1 [Nicrophorus vespilloides]
MKFEKFFNLVPNKLKFSAYTDEDVLKLSVLEITVPSAYDPMGVPRYGGLYDLRLGSFDKNPCLTCKNVFNCPGHFGHIRLPLPVISPIWSDVLHHVLKLICFDCYHLQIRAPVIELIRVVQKMINAGMINETAELSDNIYRWKGLKDMTPELVETLSTLEIQADEILAHGNVPCNANLEYVKSSVISQVFNRVLTVKCINCSKKLMSIEKVKYRYILKDFMKSVVHLNTVEIMNIMHKVWDSNSEVLMLMIPILKEVKLACPLDVFFCRVIPVIPSNARPPMRTGDSVSEHRKNDSYIKIMKSCMTLYSFMKAKKTDISELPKHLMNLISTYKKENLAVECIKAWDELQNAVNMLLNNNDTSLKAVLEKKAGLLRKNMMGKRVNYAARSVITPDPNLNIDEIGVPEDIAKKLTFNMPVGPHNVEEVRQLILNGVDVHPGAMYVVFEKTGRVLVPAAKKDRESLAKCLLTPCERRGSVKAVLRHLKNGDMLLMNRQPTLHKPSMMTHYARILKREKTFRLHYANCKAYNADFDGDEINAHFPQDTISQTECKFLSNVSSNYLVPKDGTPLSGLIQDHVISGVKMTIRGRFFSKLDYQQLVYEALSGHRIAKIKLLPPAILKPQVLWSGKQILSTVILNTIPKNVASITLTGKSKIPANAWNLQGGKKLFDDEMEMSEAEVIIRNGELIAGILDKSHYGSSAYGLVHCIYELYGGDYAIKLLSSLSRIFTVFLQSEGFTLGVRDIVVLSEADKIRSKIIKKSRKLGQNIVTSALSLSEDLKTEEIVEIIEEQKKSNPKIVSIIDRQYKTTLDSYTNDINKVCLPSGLVYKFPTNNLQLMVQSGAKGTTVNTMQISCLLGQIELEGKRPPIMISGRSLPSFPVTEFAPRAGGFIDGRFMTGIQPQEFFFHCMAGREGLIDTAVKTSRSGYLQRCLIKSLEGLTIAYDLTVRDSDGSVIQFNYGEDGMDISKVQFLNEKQIPFLADNFKTMWNKDLLKTMKEDLDAGVEEQRNQVKLYKSGEVKKVIVDPVASRYQPDVHFGAVNERVDDLFEGYLKNKDKKIKKKLQDTFWLKAMRSLACPGDSIGVLAAQSIGEPSTQMTLNTFHFAGRGDMNVTLGIPRLREIFMYCSTGQPSMEVPFLEGIENLEQESKKLCKQLTPVRLVDVLEKIDVQQKLVYGTVRQLKTVFKFHFMPYELYKDKYYLKPKKIIKYMQKKFLLHLNNVIKRHIKLAIKHHKLSVDESEDGKEKRTKKKIDDDDEEIDVDVGLDDDGPGGNNQDSSDESDEEMDKEDAKQSAKHTKEDDENEEEMNEDEEDVENIDPLSDDESDEESESKQKGGNEKASNCNVDKDNRWYQIEIMLPIYAKRIDLKSMLREAVQKGVLNQTKGIKRAMIFEEKGRLMLRTEGLNMGSIYQHFRLLDLNKVYINDIVASSRIYGIEAAGRTLVKEVKDVFGVYGITVDPRHLSLVADYMTHTGKLRSMSRVSQRYNTSITHQISYESALHFLKDAVIKGKTDDLAAPSGRIMVGSKVNSGTGVFSLLQKL